MRQAIIICRPQRRSSLLAMAVCGPMPHRKLIVARTGHSNTPTPRAASVLWVCMREAVGSFFVAIDRTQGQHLRCQVPAPVISRRTDRTRDQGGLSENYHGRFGRTGVTQ